MELKMKFKKYIKYKCPHCNRVFVCTDDRWDMRMCDCGKSGVDLETYYTRFIGKDNKYPKLVEEFDPPWFEDESDYHSVLMTWLNDSDDTWSLFKDSNILYIQRKK